jgi:hypothetical protein
VNFNSSLPIFCLLPLHFASSPDVGLVLVQLLQLGLKDGVMVLGKRVALLLKSAN